MIEFLFPYRRLLALALLLTLAGCASTPQQERDTRRLPSVPGAAEERTVNVLLERAENQPSPAAENTYLEAARRLTNMGREEAAGAILASLDTRDLDTDLATEILLLRASLELAAHRNEAVLALLDSELPAPLPQLSGELQKRIRLLRAQAYENTNQLLASARERINADKLMSPEEQRLNHELIWNQLTALPAARLTALAENELSFEFQGWYELALVDTANQYNLDRQLVALNNWREAWSRHPAARRMPRALQMLDSLAEERPASVALLLPLDSAAGEVVRNGFMSAYFNVREIGGQVPAIKLYDTSSVDDILQLHERARAEGAEMIIGPLQKQHVARLQAVADLGVPTLALNTIEGAMPRSDLLFQFALSPENEARQIAARAWRDGHRYAAVLSPGEAQGEDFLARKRESFMKRWRELGGTIVDQAQFSDSYTEVIEDLLNLDNSEARKERLAGVLGEPLEFTQRRRQDIDFIFLIAQPGPARQINPSLAYLYAGDIPVYATQDVYSGVPRPLDNRDLNGILFGDSPWLLASNDELRAEIQALFPQNNALYLRLQAFGVDAFRLHPRLRQLDDVADSRIHGATGLLKMNENRHINQELSWARFSEGLAVPVNPAPDLQSGRTADEREQLGQPIPETGTPL